MIMVCLSCKTGEMVEATNAYFVQLNSCYVIIENVPCYKCNQCGEIYYKASVLEKIDELMEQIEHVASKIFIMDYTKVA
jgi:YgiT-type zinc finger domain-containing protein